MASTKPWIFISIILIWFAIFFRTLLTVWIGSCPRLGLQEHRSPALMSPSRTIRNSLARLICFPKKTATLRKVENWQNIFIFYAKHFYKSPFPWQTFFRLNKDCLTPKDSGKVFDSQHLYVPSLTPSANDILKMSRHWAPIICFTIVGPSGTSEYLFNDFGKIKAYSKTLE